MADAIKILQTKSDLQHTVVVYGGRLEMPGVTSAGDFLTGKPAPLHYEQTSFDHPLYILYSSGTTGPPKCICHTVGGALLTHKKEHMLHMEIDADSVYYQYTTTGWMMWNYMIGALASGARIVLYDGSPLHPTPGAQLQILEREGVTHWGTSPKFLGALKRSWSSSFHLLQLEALKLTSSAGSPLIADLYHWFYDHFPRSVALISGSGGSDLVGTLVGGSPMTPVHAGEISCAYLGMKVEIWDLEGKAITDSGEGGELIVSRPFFSMPLRLWGDRGDEKYRRTYFETFPGNWCHGDYIRKHPETGGYEILGRSDGILNPGGKH
jgi:acetoacetyl-CoA synthetase